MIGKPIVPRELARRDVEKVIDDYRGHAGERIAAGFVDAPEAAYNYISEHAATGFPSLLA